MVFCCRTFWCRSWQFACLILLYCFHSPLIADPRLYEIFNCRDSIKGIVIQQQALKMSAEARKAAYEMQAQIVSRMQQSLEPQDFTKFIDWYHSQFFFDRDLILQDALRRSGKSKKAKDWVPGHYNRKGEFPLDGYIEARRHLFRKSFYELNLDDLIRANEAMLSKKSVSEVRGISQPANSELTADQDLGSLRSEFSYTSHSEEKTDAGPRRLIDGKRLKHGAFPVYHIILKRNKYLKVYEDGTVGFFDLNNYRRFSSELTKSQRLKLEHFEKEGQLDWDVENAEVDALRKEIIARLLSQKLKAVQKLLKNISNDPMAIIRNVANFAHDFISIHPFINGNGRMMRLLIERMLDEVGLPRPLWTHWEYDVFLSKADFAKLLWDAVGLSAQFHDDLNKITEQNFDYRDLPTTFWTHLPPTKPADLDVAASEFMLWANLTTIPKLLPLNKIFEAFELWLSDRQYRDGLFIRPATPYFARSFGKLSNSSEDFDRKRSAYYFLGKIFRGLPLWEDPSDEEILKMFAKFEDESIVGNGVNPEKISEAFDRFNRDLVRNPLKLFQRAHAHATGTTLAYWRSGMISFSTLESEATKWMQTQDGGFTSEERAQLRGGLLVEALNRKPATIRTDSHEIDAFGENHSFPHTGESEVLLVGGADPESIESVRVQSFAYQVCPRCKKVHGDAILHVSRTRRFTRLSFNLIELIETDAAGNQVRNEKYEIQADGHLKQLKVD